MSIIKVEDTDCWMHLSMGKLIWENKGLPAAEQFVYPSFGMKFSYSSWLFGVIYYLSYLFFKIPGVIILKAITITSAFFILLKDSLRPYKNIAISVLIMMLIVIITRHRFAERPETFMMVFLSFSIFSLNAYLYEKKKYIYWLPVVHMLWANCHSSINIMLVPFTAFIAGGLLHKYLDKKGVSVDCVPSSAQLKTIAFVFIASFAASLLSPYFINQYFFAAQYLADPWFKQEVLELQRPEWNIVKWLYLGTSLIVLSFILNWKRLSVVNLLMLLPFVVVSFSAKRFLFLFAIVSAPVVIRNLSAFFETCKWGRFANGKVVTLFCSLLVFILTTAALVKGTPFDGDRKAFGIGADYNYVPEKALQYLDKNGIYGRVFNIFDWGGYIIWRDFPHRTVFVDPRGYLPKGLIEKINLAIGRPFELDALEKQYGFDYILIKYPFMNIDVKDLDAGLLHPGWSLVYWDDTSLVYLKKDGRYKEIAERDEYRFVKPANGLSGLKSSLLKEDNRTGIIEDLKRNIKETGSFLGMMLLGYSYNETGLYEEALKIFLKLASVSPREYLLQSYSGIAYSYEKLRDLDKAIEYYKKIMDERKDAGILYEIGRLYFAKGDKKDALKYFEKTLKKDRDYIDVYPLIINIYQELGKSNEAAELMKYYNELVLKNTVTEHFQKGVNAYLDGRFEEALGEFRKAVELNPRDARSYSNIGYIYYDIGDTVNAYAYQIKALEIDPGLANAHYGLAMIFKRHRDFVNEKRHLEEYLRLEPAGYYSRRAMEEIEMLNKVLKN